MKIRFYGRLADALGKDLDFPVSKSCSVEELKRKLSEANPAAAAALGSKRVRACIGDTIVADDHHLGPADEVEFLAPVSGG